MMRRPRTSAPFAAAATSQPLSHSSRVTSSSNTTYRRDAAGTLRLDRRDRSDRSSSLWLDVDRDVRTVWARAAQPFSLFACACDDWQVGFTDEVRAGAS